MYKKIIGVIMAAALLTLSFAACGTGSKNATPMDSYRVNEAYPTTAASLAGDGGYHKNDGVQMESGSYAAAEGEYYSLAGSGSVLESVSNAILAERKIIRSANLSIEVDDFEEARNNINTIINGIGIVQESNIRTEKYYVDDDNVRLLKSGTIVLRVYKEKFDSVLNSLKGIGDVTNETITGQDVTDQYMDIESRLRVLKLEQSKLEEYLAKLNDLDAIFKTESRLSEIRYQIESLTGNLNKISSLVELSTITLSVKEINPDAKRQKPTTYWSRLGNNLRDNLEGVGYFLGDFFIFIVGAIPVLFVIGLFVLFGAFIVRRIRRGSKKKGSRPDGE